MHRLHKHLGSLVVHMRPNQPEMTKFSKNGILHIDNTSATATVRVQAVRAQQEQQRPEMHWVRAHLAAAGMWPVDTLNAKGTVYGAVLGQPHAIIVLSSKNDERTVVFAWVLKVGE